MPTPQSVSDRLLSKGKFHAQWAEAMTKRLDAIDEAESMALPIIEREMIEREANAKALAADADTIVKLAEQIVKGANDPTVTLQPSVQGSGQANGAGGHEVVR